MLELKDTNLEEAKKYMDNYVSSYLNKKSIVETQEYKNWLVNFTNSTNNQCWSDDDYIYIDSITEEDKNNIQLLSYFYSYVNEQKTKQQIIFSELDINEKDEFYEEILIFKLKNNYYKLLLAIGQGAFTTIEKLKNIPISFVYLDEEVPEEEKQNNSLYECIIINSDITFTQNELYDYISSVTIMMSDKEHMTEKYNYWKKFDLKNRMYVYVNNENIDLLAKKFYNIKYKETNNIAIVSLGIKNKKEIYQIINKFKES